MTPLERACARVGRLRRSLDLLDWNADDLDALDALIAAARSTTGPRAMVPNQYATLREANVARQIEWANGQEVSLLFRATELGGECGEVLNVVKKIAREREGWRGSRATTGDLADELADVVICADLLAAAEGIDLEAAVARKFNATSEKQGFPHRMIEAALT